MTKRKVPESRIKEVADRIFPAIPRETVRIVCDVFAEVLAENPIVPTREQAAELYELPFDNNGGKRGENRFTIAAVTEWQRRMFLEPESKPEIKDLLWDSNPYPNTGAEYRHDEAVKEAYRRGQKSK